jgi:hypothetical protein
MKGTTVLSVVGGVYAESIRTPRRYELYGSGGRAAAALSSLKADVTLVTVMDRSARELFEPMADSFGFRLSAVEVATTAEFIYDHPLGPPRTRPLLNEIVQADLPLVTAENVLVFGMLEGQPTVKATRTVYDPQSPLSPKWFEENGSSAEEVTYVLNWREGNLLTRENDPEAIIRAVLARPNVKACALKLGPRGALVGDAS